MIKEQLIEQLVQNVEKIYFYCIKRCNNRIDAEDLSQTIYLEILQNINKGIQIDNFDYYIWAICKNQYNKYLKDIVFRREKMDFQEVIDEPADNINSLDEMINDENIKKMNLAIKLLSKDYNEILYAYYVEDKKLSYIANQLNLPLGTVGRKLSEIRQKLKEYLDMEQLNGKKAYVPKQFIGLTGGYATFNVHDVVKPLMVKNLLFHSYNNPCSIEDYCIELGVSKPYIEDYIFDLVNKQFLTKLDNNKYITNIAFINKDLRRELYDYCRNNVTKFNDEIIKFCKENISYYKSLLLNPNIDDEHLMWSFILVTLITLENTVLKIKFTKDCSPENPQAKWDYMMAESIENLYPDEFGISHNVYGNDILEVSGMSFPAGRISNEVSKIIAWNREFNVNELLQFASEFNRLTDEEKRYSKLDEDKKTTIDQCIEYNYLKVVNDILCIKAPCIMVDNYNKLLGLIKSNNVLIDELKNIYDKISSCLMENISPNLISSIDFIVMGSCLIRSYVCTEAYNQGLLKDEEGKYFPYNKIVILK